MWTCRCQVGGGGVIGGHGGDGGPLKGVPISLNSIESLLNSRASYVLSILYVVYPLFPEAYLREREAFVLAQYALLLFLYFRTALLISISI